MFNHRFHHIYKFLCMVVQLSYRSDVQNIPYPPYIHILWVSYMPQRHLAVSYSMPRNYFLACSIPIYLDLKGCTLASMIGPKQMLLDAWLWEHVASMNLVHEVSSLKLSVVLSKRLSSAFIYFIFGWCCMTH